MVTLCMYSLYNKTGCYLLMIFKVFLLNTFLYSFSIRSAESVTVDEVILSASIDDSEDCAKKMVCIVNAMDASELSPRYVQRILVVVKL